MKIFLRCVYDKVVFGVEFVMAKIVNGDTYIHRQYIYTLSHYFVDRIDLAAFGLPINYDWNVVKIDRDGVHITFCYYPDFEILAHPKLFQWNKVNVVSGNVISRKESAENPIILHRKERFVDCSDENYDMYANLTRQEVRAGLYAKENLSRIGYEKYWKQLLDEKGLMIIDHTLCFMNGKEYETECRRGKER